MLPCPPSLLPYLIEKKIHKVQSSLILYCRRIRKNVTENREQTDRNQITEKPIIEATLISMDRRVEWTNNKIHIYAQSS